MTKNEARRGEDSAEGERKQLRPMRKNEGEEWERKEAEEQK